MNKFKKQIYYILHNSEGRKGFLYKIDDYLITSFIIISVLLVIAESFVDGQHRFLEEFRIAEIIVVVVFTIEFILRIRIADLVFP